MILNQITVDEYEKLIKDISSKEKIYIYGAGIAGSNVGKYFNMLGIKWYGYVDSDPNKIGKTINGKYVYFFKEVVREENIIFQIAVGRMCRDDIKKCLSENGCKYLYIEDINFIYKIAYKLNESNLKLRKLEIFKDAHKGKRCFIIGNGPSLKVEDLEKISNEYTFATNSVYNIYQNTSWRPYYYVVSDQVAENEIIEKDLIKSISEGTHAIFNECSKLIFAKYGYLINNIYYYKACFSDKNLEFSKDITKYLVESYTTVYIMYQIAAYMGFKEIYLLGMDFDFRKVIYNDGTSKTNESVEDHPKMLKGNENGVYFIDGILNTHKVAKKYADGHGIKIYNATRGGKLEVFPRVDFDSLF